MSPGLQKTSTAKHSVFLRIQVSASSQTKGLERGCEASAPRAGKTLTSRFSDFFTESEEKNHCFAVYGKLYVEG